jgi:hypothetical protein
VREDRKRADDVDRRRCERRRWQGVNKPKRRIWIAANGAFDHRLDAVKAEQALGKHVADEESSDSPPSAPVVQHRRVVPGSNGAVLLGQSPHQLVKLKSLTQGGVSTVAVSGKLQMGWRQCRKVRTKLGKPAQAFGVDP